MKNYILILITGIVLIISITAAAFSLGLSQANEPDSGVASCQKIVDNAAKTNKSHGGGTYMTEEQYQELRKGFEESEHKDIKVAGVAFVGLVYEYSNNPGKGTNNEDDLRFVGQVYAKWALLENACANHGVDLPPLI